MMRPSTELPGLADIYLEDSYVLGVEARPAELRFLVDFVLTPSHEQYRPPPPGDQHCYRKGWLIFKGVTRLLWADQGAPPARDASGELDWGNIDEYEWDESGHHLSGGDWGRIDVVTDAVTVELV
jgi:hypothetical protein